jgi:hypothetical protein
MKITPTQQGYLDWFYKGNSIHILIECFSRFGETTYISPLPFKADRRALENLKRRGFLKFTDEYHYGLRWLVVSLSDKAVKFMEEQA